MDNLHEQRVLPERWEIVNLPEIVFFQEGPGVRKHQFTTEGIKLINVGNLANNELVLNNTETHISTEEATTKYKHFLVDEGDLIIASSGIKVDYFHKKIAFAKREHLPLCMNTSTIRFKVLNKNKISMKFFRYFLMTRFFSKQVQFHITGSAQLNFGPSHLEKMKVILPPLEIQNKIVSILEKAEETKKLRAQADELTDRLLQSVFLEMFGDPVRNPKGWEIKKLDHLSEIVSGVTKGRKISGNYVVSVPYLRVANVQDGFLNLKEIKMIDALPSEVEKFALLEGDILLTEGGDPDKLGRGAVWHHNIPNCIHQNHIFRVRVDKESIAPEFLSMLIGSPYGKVYFLKSAKQTTGIATINSTQLKNFPVLVPPIELQSKFARIVEKVEAMRQSQNQSKQQIEGLFSALMQKAFRGEI